MNLEESFTFLTTVISNVHFWETLNIEASSDTKFAKFNLNLSVIKLQFMWEHLLRNKTMKVWFWNRANLAGTILLQGK